MSKTKREALADAKTKDVKDSIGTRRPAWMVSSSSWKLFFQHWNNPHTIRVSNSAKRSRAVEGAGGHGLGNAGLKRRMRAMQDKTGIYPSPFIILLEQNRKKNKVTGVDEVHSIKFQRAWEKYILLFKARYGEELEATNYPPNLQIWDAIDEVSPGRKKVDDWGSVPLGSRTYSMLPLSLHVIATFQGTRRLKSCWKKK